VIWESSVMVATDKLFVGKIPEIYDRLLVPLLFESYARDLAERVANVKPQEALETAAGTGVLTREIASRIPAHARVWLPISTSRCSIMPLRSSLPIPGSYGSRPMR